MLVNMILYLKKLHNLQNKICFVKVLNEISHDHDIVTAT